MGDDRRALGQLGEDLAAEALARRGYHILTRNFRCRHGEMDIIASHGGVLVFVEVKTRRSCGYGPPAEAVTFAKQQRMASTAQFYLNQGRHIGRDCRFDVVSVLLQPGKAAEIEIIAAAFELS